MSLSGRDRVAYDLFSASFSMITADARFIMLMMAVETLLKSSASISGSADFGPLVDLNYARERATRG